MANDRDSQSQLGRYAGLSTQWMVMLLVAVWLGHKADLYTGWKVPVFVILMPLVSLVFSLVQLIKEVNRKKE